MNNNKCAISASNICFSNGQTLQELFDSGKLLTTKTIVKKEVLQQEVLDAKYNKILAQNEEKINGLVEKINLYDKKINTMTERIEQEYERINNYFKGKELDYNNIVRESSSNFASNLRDVKEQMVSQNRDFYNNNVVEVKNLLNSQKQEVNNLTQTLMNDVNIIAEELKECVSEVTDSLSTIATETRTQVMQDLLKVEKNFQKDMDEKIEYIKEYLVFLEDEIKFTNDLQEKVEMVLQHKTPKEQIKEVEHAVKEVVEVVKEEIVEAINPGPEQFFEETGEPKKSLFRFVSAYEEPIEDNEQGMEIIDVDLTFTTNGKYRTSYKYAIQDGKIQRIKYQQPK